MRKIPTIFKRNPDNLKEILNERNSDCLWVFNGEGVATRKYDGTCCLIEDGKLWRRREVKKGAKTPNGFKFADYDENTGKTVGWVIVDDTPQNKWHIEAFCKGVFDDGTYELCGNKVQGNPERVSGHVLISHSGATKYSDFDRTFEGIKSFMSKMDIEGLVFHHEDGRMAKIKKRDYQMVRSCKLSTINDKWEKV